MIKKHVRFEASALKDEAADLFSTNGIPIETIDLLSSMSSPSKSSKLRLHLGVLRTCQTYHAAVLIKSDTPFSVDAPLPKGCDATSNLAAWVRQSPAEDVPDVCLFVDSQMPYCLHLLVTPKQEGLFTFTAEVSIKTDYPDGAQLSNITLKIIGNSLDSETGKPSLREGVRLFVGRDPSDEEDGG